MTPKRIFITYGTKNFDLQKKFILLLQRMKLIFSSICSLHVEAIHHLIGGRGLPSSF